MTNDPGIFVYQAPTISNNPFLDLPQQNNFSGTYFLDQYLIIIKITQKYIKSYSTITKLILYFHLF